jgi:hypothetical protein
MFLSASDSVIVFIPRWWGPDVQFKRNDEKRGGQMLSRKKEVKECDATNV